MIKGLAKNNNGELEQKLQNDNHNHEPRWARNHYNNHNTIDKLAKLQGPTSRFSLNTKQYKRSA